MTTVTLYKIHSGFANVANSWSVTDARDPMKNDFAQDFDLPEGYGVATAASGEARIFFNDNDTACDLVEHSSGWPQIVGPEAPGKFPVLKPKSEERF